MTTDEPKLISIRQAASYLGVSREVVTKGVNSGQIPSVELGSRRWIPIAALARWLMGNNDH